MAEQGGVNEARRVLEEESDGPSRAALRHIDEFAQTGREATTTTSLAMLQEARPSLQQPGETRPVINDRPSDVINTKQPLGIMSKGTVAIESMFFSTYTYHHNDGTRMLSSRRTLCGFNIYSCLDNDRLVAQLKGNIFGTRYNMDNSLQIKYETSFLQRGSPRSFTVRLGNLELCNKKPYFNTETMSYSLNFNGRITQPSVRNMQIIHPLDPNYITLTFGKERENAYILDFSYPWTPLRAFCIALSALDHKFGCD